MKDVKDVLIPGINSEFRSTTTKIDDIVVQLKDKVNPLLEHKVPGMTTEIENITLQLVSVNSDLTAMKDALGKSQAYLDRLSSASMTSDTAAGGVASEAEAPPLALAPARGAQAAPASPGRAPHPGRPGERGEWGEAVGAPALTPPER